VGQTALWWAWELVGLAASLLGPTALAAQSVLLVSCSTTYQVPFSLGQPTSVRIGQLLGLARPRLAKLAAILLGFALSLIFSVAFWIWRKEWSYLFNDDEGEYSLTASEIMSLKWWRLFQVFDGNAGITGGVLRARGKQGTGALHTQFEVRFPLGVLQSSLMDPQSTALLRGLWIGLIVSLVYCAVLGTILCLMTDWELTFYIGPREVGPECSLVGPRLRRSRVYIYLSIYLYYFFTVSKHCVSLISIISF
ncbi:hypothetical protein F5877DRAFT_54838, partial [Lentinula edodes]